MNFSADEIKNLASPLFDAFRPLVECTITENEFVTPLEIYNHLAGNKSIVSGGGQVVRFAPPSIKTNYKYEEKVFLTGEIETRVTVRHDLFNAWVWLTFPKTKAAVNAGHYRALQVRCPRAPRSSIEDALTLLDENGVVVVCSDVDLIQLLKTAQWKTLFWHRRADITSRMRVFLFGHGLLEKAMRPYVGMCAHSVVLPVQSEFFSLGLTDQVRAVDQSTAQYLAKLGQGFNTRAMTAIPLLGFPGYFADNTVEAFYDNLHYFRPKEMAQKKEPA